MIAWVLGAIFATVAMVLVGWLAHRRAAWRVLLAHAANLGVERMPGESFEALKTRLVATLRAPMTGSRAGIIAAVREVVPRADVEVASPESGRIVVTLRGFRVSASDVERATTRLGQVVPMHVDVEVRRG